MPAAREKRRRAASPAVAGATAHGPLFDELRRYRLERARAAGAAPYTIFHDRTLAEIAARRPATLAALASVHGMGAVKLERYGAAVLDLVRRVREETLSPLWGRVGEGGLRGDRQSTDIYSVD